MSDLIDRRAAIGLIHSLYPSVPIMRMNREQWKKKYKTYIEVEKALEQLPSAQPEPCGDAVSRQYILGALAEYIEEYEEVDVEGNHDPKWCAMKEAEMVVKEAPSVEPEHDENELNFMQPHKRIPVQLVVSSDCISRKAAIEAMEDVDWYHINKDGQLAHGANSKEDEPLYKAEDVYKALNDMPSAQQDIPTNTSNIPTNTPTDCISRQAVIDEIMKELKDRSLHDDEETSEDFADGYDEGIRNAATRVYLLPSAQPDIIHCRECKYYKYVTSIHGECECGEMWHSLFGEITEVEAIEVHKDHYCGYAERREVNDED